MAFTLPHQLEMG